MLRTRRFAERERAKLFISSKTGVRARAMADANALEASDEEGMAESIYPVKCCCGWFGMSDDCRRNECPNCGLRVTREFNEEERKR